MHRAMDPSCHHRASLKAKTEEMTLQHLPLLTRRWISGVVLLAVLARVWVPAGFMPSTGHGIALKFCHAGMSMPAEPVSPGSQPARAGHAEHCPFGSAPSMGFVVTALLAVATALVVACATFEFSTLHASLRLPRAHRSRAPPPLH